ncbi:hypothetical protein D3C75_1274040 [compost metagenome]
MHQAGEVPAVIHQINPEGQDANLDQAVNEPVDGFGQHIGKGIDAQMQGFPEA